MPLYSALFSSHLALASRTCGVPVGQAGEIHLDGREGQRLRVAQHADVELAALDVLLDQGGVVDLLVDRAARAPSFRVVLCTSDLASMPMEASMRSGLTNSGMRRLPPVSRSASCEKTAKSG